MKVYLLMGSYYDGVESWESLEGIYANSEDAELESIRLNELFFEENSPCSNTSFCVISREVL